MSDRPPIGSTVVFPDGGRAIVRGYEDAPDGRYAIIGEWVGPRADGLPWVTIFMDRFTANEIKPS